MDPSRNESPNARPGDTGLPWIRVSARAVSRPTHMGAPGTLRGDLVGTGFAGTARTVLAERYVTSKKNRHTRRSSGVVSWPTSFTFDKL
jgi:hypothetical protein